MYIFISVPSVSGTFFFSDLPGPSSVLPSIGGSGPAFLSPYFPTSSDDSDGVSKYIGNRKDHRDYIRKALEFPLLLPQPPLRCAQCYFFFQHFLFTVLYGMSP